MSGERRLRIYTFVERYPSPYKGYLDTQFAQFVRDGHDLRIFAHGHFPDPVEPQVATFGLDRRTAYLPGMLRALPSSLGRIAGEGWRSGGRSVRNGLHLVRALRPLRRAILAGSQAALLPVGQPDLCLIQGVVAGRRLWWLRRIYPEVRLVLYYHGNETPGTPARPVEELAPLFQAMDRAVTNTRASASVLTGLGCPVEKVAVVPLGLNLGQYPFRPHRAGPPAPLRVLCAGRISPEKGHSVLLRALALMRTRGISVECRITGNGLACDEVRSLTSHLGLQDTVHLLGFLERQDLVAELLAADVLVLPSIAMGGWEENQALIVQEAMLTGLPVIASRTGGVPESLAPELHRFLTSPGDPDQLAARLAEFAATSASDRVAFAHAGRQFAEARYDISLLNRRLLDAAMEPSVP